MYVCMYDGVNIVCVCREYTLDVYRMASVVTEVSALQWNLVSTNTVKAKYLLNTNHFEPPGIKTLIQLATVIVKFLVIHMNIFYGPLEFMLMRFHCMCTCAL